MTRTSKILTLAVLAVAIQLAAASGASALGQITYGGCISGDGSGGLCGSAGSTALDGARASDISPDGRQLYVASFNGNSVVVLDRAPGGQAPTRAAYRTTAPAV